MKPPNSYKIDTWQTHARDNIHKDVETSWELPIIRKIHLTSVLTLEPKIFFRNSPVLKFASLMQQAFY